MSLILLSPPARPAHLLGSPPWPAHDPVGRPRGGGDHRAPQREREGGALLQERGRAPPARPHVVAAGASGDARQSRLYLRQRHRDVLGREPHHRDGLSDLQGAALSCHVHTPTKPHAQRPVINQTQTASIMLNITLPPLAVRILGSDQHVSAGRPLRLECQALGSFPPAQLSWWRGHSRLRQVVREVEGGGNITKATLTLMIDRSFHGVTLSCRGSNPALPGRRPSPTPQAQRQLE
nr:uncharacterized protein LOC113824413 [Penaeus vannamei]